MHNEAIIISLYRNRFYFLYETSHVGEEKLNVSHLNAHQMYTGEAFFHFRSIRRK